MLQIEIRDRPGKPIVLCTLGDGTSQQGEVMEAIAEAARSELPVLFVDRRQRLFDFDSHRRPDVLFRRRVARSSRRAFMGLPIHRLDGRDVPPCYRQLGPIVDGVRSTRRPALAVLRVERLDNHSNADDESVYRGEIVRREARETGDPIQNLGLWLMARGLSPRSARRNRGKRSRRKCWLPWRTRWWSNSREPCWMRKPNCQRTWFRRRSNFTVAAARPRR